MLSGKFSTLDVIFVISCGLAAFLLQDYAKLKGHLQSKASLLNNTAKANQSFMIFNRVPKAGTNTLWEVIDAVAINQNNSFKSLGDSAKLKEARGENTFMFEEHVRKTYVEMFENSEEIGSLKHFSYSKHMNFLNFEEFNRTNPVYVNMVRHPVERVISWYYYQRQSSYIIYRDERNETVLKKKHYDPPFYKRSYEDCFLQQLPECHYPINGSTHLTHKGKSHTSQIAFFCGNQLICDVFGSREALELAKSNVEKYYSVVGVLELWNETLQTLEHYIPFFFKDAIKAYKEIIGNRIVNKNQSKPKVPKFIKDAIAKNFTVEMEFFEFCKQRIYKQYLAIK